MGLPPYYLTPVGISTSHHVTLAGTQSALALIGLVRADSWRAAANTSHSLHRFYLSMARSTSGPPTNSRSKGQQKRGHVSGRAGAREKFLIFLRNLVSRTRANASRVRFVGKPVRAVSGNPAVAGQSRNRLTIWISRHYTRCYSELLHKQMNLQCSSARRMLADARGWSHLDEGHAPWHGSCQTGHNQ